MERPKAKPDPKPVPVLAVKKALDLLEALLFDVPPGQGVALVALAAKRGLLPNTARNLLKTMIACGYVAQTDDSLYVPGPQCQRIGRRNRLATERAGGVLLARLTALAAATRETGVFAVLSGADRAVLAEVDGGQSVRIDRAVIQEGRLYDTPTGRVLLAWASPQERRAVVARHGLPKGVWNGIDSPAKLDAALAAVRKDGLYTLDQGQVIAFACPVFDGAGELLGALGCYAPSFRCDEQARKKISRQMRLTSAALAKVL